MVLVKKWPFFQTFFLGNISQENVFYDILELKKAFLGYRNKKFKIWKNWHFSKGVKPWFWSKNCHFCKVFFLSNIGQENVFYNILEQKNACLGYKNKMLKKSNNWLFPRGLPHGFGPKMTIIPNCFLSQYRRGKCLLRHSRTKKLLSRR